MKYKDCSILSNTGPAPIISSQLIIAFLNSTHPLPISLFESQDVFGAIQNVRQQSPEDVPLSFLGGSGSLTFRPAYPKKRFNRRFELVIEGPRSR